jgi:hypothetical protein
VHYAYSHNSVPVVASGDSKQRQKAHAKMMKMCVLTQAITKLINSLTALNKQARNHLNVSNPNFFY